MNSEHVKAEWVLNQLTVARWHLDRAATVVADAARREVDMAREICENLARVLPDAKVQDEQCRRMQAGLSELQDRLSAMRRGAGK